MARKSDLQLLREKLNKNIKRYKKEGYDIDRFVDNKEIGKLNTNQANHLLTFLKEQVAREKKDSKNVYKKYQEAYENIMGDLSKYDEKIMLSKNIISEMLPDDTSYFQLKEETTFLRRNKKKMLEKLGDVNESRMNGFLERYFKDFYNTYRNGEKLTDVIDTIKGEIRSSAFNNTFIEVLTDEDFKKLYNYEKFEKNWGSVDSTDKIEILANRFERAKELTYLVLDGGDWMSYL